MLVVSSCETALTIEGRTVWMAEAGVHFQADVPVANNSKLAPLSQWMGAGDVATYGTWGESSDSLSLGLRVTFDIPLWDGAVLQNISLSFNEKNGTDARVNMTGKALVTLPFANMTNEFTVTGEVTSTKVALSSTLSSDEESWWEARRWG